MGSRLVPREMTYMLQRTLTGNIYRYEIVNGKSVEERKIFANVMIKPPIEHGRVAGPDGMAFDREGNLYVSVLIQGDITVIDPSGNVKDGSKTDQFYRQISPLIDQGVNAFL